MNILSDRWLRFICSNETLEINWNESYDAQTFIKLYQQQLDINQKFTFTFVALSTFFIVFGIIATLLMMVGIFQRKYSYFIYEKTLTLNGSSVITFTHNHHIFRISSIIICINFLILILFKFSHSIFLLFNLIVSFQEYVMDKYLDEEVVWKVLYLFKQCWISPLFTNVFISLLPIFMNYGFYNILVKLTKNPINRKNERWLCDGKENKKRYREIILFSLISWCTVISWYLPYTLSFQAINDKFWENKTKKNSPINSICVSNWSYSSLFIFRIINIIFFFLIQLAITFYFIFKYRSKDNLIETTYHLNDSTKPLFSPYYDNVKNPSSTLPRGSSGKSTDRDVTDRWMETTEGTISKDSALEYFSRSVDVLNHWNYENESTIDIRRKNASTSNFAGMLRKNRLFDRFNRYKYILSNESDEKLSRNDYLNLTKVNLDIKQFLTFAGFFIWFGLLMHWFFVIYEMIIRHYPLMNDVDWKLRKNCSTFNDINLKKQENVLQFTRIYYSTTKYDLFHDYLGINDDIIIHLIDLTRELYLQFLSFLLIIFMLIFSHIIRTHINQLLYCPCLFRREKNSLQLSQPLHHKKQLRNSKSNLRNSNHSKSINLLKNEQRQKMKKRMENQKKISHNHNDNTSTSFDQLLKSVDIFVHENIE
ncbi:hypothetical protein SNEBB_009249 [Seison nebaliae]|nr:hypothetical protein SNEBB_009249 [Seison nebaliae]